MKEVIFQNCFRVFLSATHSELTYTAVALKEEMCTAVQALFMSSFTLLCCEDVDDNDDINKAALSYRFFSLLLALSLISLSSSFFFNLLTNADVFLTPVFLFPTHFVFVFLPSRIFPWFLSSFSSIFHHPISFTILFFSPYFSVSSSFAGDFCSFDNHWSFSVSFLTSLPQSSFYMFYLKNVPYFLFFSTSILVFFSHSHFLLLPSISLCLLSVVVSTFVLLTLNLLLKRPNGYK